MSFECCRTGLSWLHFAYPLFSFSMTFELQYINDFFDLQQPASEDEDELDEEDLDEEDEEFDEEDDDEEEDEDDDEEFGGMN